jgi:hypothetical protein
MEPHLKLYLPKPTLPGQFELVPGQQITQIPRMVAAKEFGVDRCKNSGVKNPRKNQPSRAEFPFLST